MKARGLAILVYFLGLLAGGSAAVTWSGGGAGGGRIGVRCSYNHYYGALSVTHGTGYRNGEVGTIYWRIQGPGTMFRIR